MTYIEQLLEKFDDIEAKAQFTGLAEKYSFLNDYIVDPGVKTKTEEISQWAETEWDYDHGMSKREYQQEQELEIYKTQLEAAGNRKMKTSELEDLDSFLGDYIKKQGLVSKTEYDAAIKEKSEAFETQLNVISRLTTRVPYLNAKHQQEFGKMFDPDDYVKRAIDGGYANSVDGLDRFYGEYTKESAEAKRMADQETLVTKAREEGAKAERDRIIASSPSGMPTLDGSPELSHFQQKIMGMNKVADPTASTAPADVELGRGTIARFAALAADARDRAAGTVH